MSFQILKNNKKIRRQKGVTLMLAMLVLSAILSIGFSLATILFVEIRNSNDLLRTEAAIYGATAGTEEAIFYYKRQVPANQYAYTRSLGSVNVTSTVTSYSDSIFQAIVPPATTFANTSNQYALFDPNNIDAGSGFGKVSISYADTGNVNSLSVYVCEYDPTASPDSYFPKGPACSDQTSTSYWLSPSNEGNFSPGQTRDYILDPTRQQKIFMYNTGTTGNMYVQISTFGAQSPPGSGVYPPKGIPYLGKVGVYITGSDSGITRRIRSVIPNVSVAENTNTTNYASFANGSSATSSSFAYFVGFPCPAGQKCAVSPPTGAIDGSKDTRWADDGSGNPAWIEVDFPSAKTIHEIDVYTLPDGFPVSSYTATTSAATNGIADFQVQYGIGGIWQTVANVTNNLLAWRQFTFPAVSNVTSIRIYITRTNNNAPKTIMELEAY